MDTSRGGTHRHRHAAVERSTNAWRRAIAVAVAAVLAMVGLAAPALAADGHVIDGAITNVTFDKTAGQDWQEFKLTLAWAVPDGSHGGDTFSLVLPPELEPRVTTTFRLDETKDGATNTVAVATWDTVDGMNRATFTLTDYVNDKSSVSGDAWFTVKFTKEMEVGTTPLVFVLGPRTIEIPMTKDPKPATNPGYGTTDRTKLYKSGAWTDTKKEGTVDPNGALTWTVSTPGSYTDALTGMQLVDTLGAGHTMTPADLAGIEVSWENIASTGGSTWYRAPLPRNEAKQVTYRVFNDDGTEVMPRPTAVGSFTATFVDGVLTVDIPLVPAREVVRVVYKTSLVDTAATSFANSASIVGTALAPKSVLTTVKRTQAGGKGVTVRNSYLVVEKVDTADGKPLAGAYFDLYSGDTLVTTLGPTAADGTVVSGKVDNGDYTLVETVAPEGYVLDATPRVASIPANATLTVTVQNALAVAEDPPPAPPVDPRGALRLTKSDADDLSRVLAGAVYQLTPAAGGDPIALPATGEDGVAVLTDLALGDYVLTETVAPVGYELSDQGVPVTIVAATTTVSVTDEPISEVLVSGAGRTVAAAPTAVVLGATGSSVLPIAMTALVLLAAGSTAVVLRRRAA